MLKHLFKYPLIKDVTSKRKLIRLISTNHGPEAVLKVHPYTPDDHILLLGLNRQHAKNALSHSLVQQLLDRLDEIHSKHPDSRALILHSCAKNVFCGGADLKERLKMPEDEVATFVDKLRSIGERLAEIPIPTIAAIDGFALGGGLELALACDIRIASDDSKMGLVETSLAIIPGAGGTQRLPRLIGIPRAKQMIFSAQILDGKQAEHIGLINECIPQNKDGNAAFKASLDLAIRMSKLGPKALRMAKLAIDQGTQVTLSTSMAVEKAAYSQLISTNDRIEGLQAFVEKRQPTYTGQ